MAEGRIYSLAYCKSGDAVFFSHLDTLRILERAVRRTGLAVCYTQGCNPHIRLSVYTAVPIGVETEGEWFSFRITRDMEPENLCLLLNRQLTSGFRIVQARKGRPPQIKKENLALEIEYSGSKETVEAAVSRWMDLEKIEIRGRKKGRFYTQDVRPFFKEYKIGNDLMVFQIQAEKDTVPRIGDLAKALYSFSSREAIEFKAVRVKKNPPSQQGASMADC